MADAELESDRLPARKLPQAAEELHHLDGRRERGMACGRDAVDALLDPADAGNLGRDLGAWQHPAVSGLGPLRQLHLDHLDLRVGSGLCESFG